MIGQPIRVVLVDGVHNMLCCGTNVKNLSQLQLIKLLNVEKTKTKLLVHFLVGNRVLNKLKISYNRELQLNLILK
jgi:misacylated tRNA(Ala) deacylase